MTVLTEAKPFLLTDICELTIVPSAPGYRSKHEATAEPFYTSHRIEVSSTIRGDSWRDKMDLDRVHDIIDFNSMAPYTEEAMRQFIGQNLEVDGEYVVTDAGRDLFGNRQYDRVRVKRILDDWKSHVRDASEAIAYAVEESHPEMELYSEKSRRMMHQMGWRHGKGLGKLEDGRLEPIEAESGEKRKKGAPTKAKELELFVCESEGETLYGKKGNRDGGEVLELWEVTVGGRAFDTGKWMWMVRELGMRHSDLTPALMWNGAPIGPADITYPHPKGWRLEVEGHDRTLEYMTVRRLTAAHRAPLVGPPSCIKRWGELYPQVDLEAVAKHLDAKLLTPRDTKCYERDMHRSMAMRSFSQGPHVMCRLCARRVESFSHLGKCCEIRKVFERFVSYASQHVPQLKLSEELVWFGWGEGELLPPPLFALYVIVWKFVVIDFTCVDTEGREFDAEKIWKAALRRFMVRLQAYSESIRLWLVNREGLDGGSELHPKLVESIEEVVWPCLSFDGHGMTVRPELEALFRWSRR